MAEAAAAAAVIEAEAEYHDGLQARPLWLRARLTPRTLELRRAGGEAVASWPVAALRVVDRAGGALRLAPEDGSDARLVVSDAALAAALEAAQRPRRRAAWKRRLRAAALAALLVPAGAFALWKGWPPAADALVRAVPAEWERPIGTATVSALVGTKRVCDAPAGQAALDALTARLAAAAGGIAALGGLRVRVVDDRTVNALAAPGGEVIVYRGLLDRAASAEELAGVLAHELAHVRHRHGLRGVTRLAGLFVLTGALTGGSDAAAVAVALVGLSHSREFEREADADGARMLAAAGIGTEGLQAFFARLEGERPRGRSGSSLRDYVNTHPTDADRVAALRAAERPANPAPAMPAADWAAVKAICGAAAGTPKPGRPAAAAPARPDRPAAATATPARRRLGTFGAWEAWAGEEHGGPVCFALADGSAPAPAGGAAVEGSKARLWFTHRPGRGPDGVGFTPDRRPPEGAAVRISFGGESFPVRMLGAHGAPPDGAAASAALRAAAAEGVAEAVVGWTDAGNGAAAPGRSYGFALGGLAEAHAAITAACGNDATSPPAPAR